MDAACTCPVCGGEIRNAPATLVEDRGMVVANGSFAVLTGSETTILRELIARFPAVASKERLYNALYALDIDGGAQEKIVDVMICKIRKKLAPLGIEITTSWGQGFALGVNLQRTSPVE